MKETVEVNNTITFQSGCHGAHIGRLDIHYANGRIVHYQQGLIEVKEAITPKNSIDQDIAGFMQSSQTKLDQVIGHTETNLYRYRQLETTMDNYYSPY